MPTYSGVIEDSTGDLLKAGYCNFSASGEIGAGQTQRTDVPFPSKRRGDEDEANMHRWNGSAWVEVAQP